MATEPYGLAGGCGVDRVVRHRNRNQRGMSRQVSVHSDATFGRLLLGGPLVDSQLGVTETAGRASRLNLRGGRVMQQFRQAPVRRYPRG